MSFGLGYLADGFLKGQERNRNWGLRQKQEERSQAADQRAQESHGIGMRIGGVNAAIAEEKMTPDAIENRQNESKFGLDLAQQNLENARAQGLGIAQQNELRSEDLTPEAKEFRTQNRAADIKAKQLQNQYNEYRNTDIGRKLEKESMAWEKHIGEIVNQKDEVEAQVQLSQALDMKRYRMIQLIESGDPMGAALFVNSSRANKHENITALQKTKDGGIVGFDVNGKAVINITPDEVKGVISRVKKGQQAKAGTPTVKTFDRPVLDENGKQIIDQLTGEPLTKKVQAQWDGESWQEVSPNSRGEGGKQPSNASLMIAGQSLVQRGVKTPEWFENKFGQPYRPSSNQNNSARNELPPTNPVSIPRPSSRSIQEANRHEWTEEELNNPLMNL